MTRRTRALTGAVPAAVLAAVLAAGQASAQASPPRAPVPTATTAGSAAPAAQGRYVVRVRPGALDAVLAAVPGTGARQVAVQRALGTVVVDAVPAAVARLGALDGVLVVAPDREVRTTSLGFSPSSQNGAMTNVTRLTGAAGLWSNGQTGRGVDIALIDSGVAPVGSLSDPAKVVVGPDLSFESQDPDLRHLDTFGHGTHMGSIIAGREGPAGWGGAYAADQSNFYGMAPDARLVSLKLADHEGAVDVSQVVAAIDWVVQYRQAGGLNIRVLNLSFGTPSAQSWQSDPLAWAAEVAWRNGIVVVASAGNDGQSRNGLSDPAYNPWVLAVGAADTRGTDDPSDDTVPAFSSRDASGTRTVDLVAPGVGIVAAGVSGSKLFTSYPGARLGNGFLRGSGTSQAAAVVSGGVALLLQRRPALTPDQVKDVLRGSARPLLGVPATAQGAGEFSLRDPDRPVSGRLQTWMPGNGAGSLDAARGGAYLTMDGVELRGERDIMGSSWSSLRMAGAASTRSAWGADGSFNGRVWIGSGFVADTTSWAGKTWGGKTWAGKTWAGTSWSGKTWAGKTWANATWTGSGWSSAPWTTLATVPSLMTRSWSGGLWTADRWR